MGRCTLPSELLTSLERQVPHETEGAEPKPKRQKLDSVAAGSAAVSLRDKVTICSALRRVLEGFPPPPHLWGLLASGNSLRHMEFILLVSWTVRVLPPQPLANWCCCVAPPPPAPPLSLTVV